MNKQISIPVAAPMIGDRELELVTEVLRSGWISSLGSYVTDLEGGVASVCAAKHGVAVSNGTSALHLALAALGIGPGDEVVVPTLSFVATANAVRYVHAKPVFVDCDPENWCMDPEQFERSITARTRAVIPVHLYGHPADMDPILAIAGRHRIAVVEDAAEALGASYRGHPVGGIGDVGIFSFYGNKLITTGEGGMLVTNDADLAARARTLRDHAMDPQRRYWHSEIGYNFRLTNVQAAIGVAQLERMGHFLGRKRAIAARYAAAFAGLDAIGLQMEATWACSSWWMFTILISERSASSRERLAAELRQAGIDTRPTFYPIHVMPPYQTGQSLSVAEDLSMRGLSLPSGVTLTDAEQDHVIERVLALVCDPVDLEPISRYRSHQASITVAG